MYTHKHTRQETNHEASDAFQSLFQPYHLIGITPACLAHAPTGLVVRTECMCFATSRVVVFTQSMVIGIVRGGVVSPGLNFTQWRRTQALYYTTHFACPAPATSILFLARPWSTGAQMFIHGRPRFWSFASNAGQTRQWLRCRTCGGTYPAKIVSDLASWWNCARRWSGLVIYRHIHQTARTRRDFGVRVTLVDAALLQGINRAEGSFAVTTRVK